MCGIAGTWNLARWGGLNRTVVALHWLYNRARGYAGIAVTDGHNTVVETGEGLTGEVFYAGSAAYERLQKFRAQGTLGHLRYPTSGNVANPADNAQPLLSPWNGQMLALAHNGNLTNGETIGTDHFPGQSFVTGMDSERLLRLIVQAAGDTIYEKIERALPYIRGSATFGILLPDRLLGVRDHSGNRPLVWGPLDGGWMMASETLALESAGVAFEQIEEVPPGTIVSFSDAGVVYHSLSNPNNIPRRQCVFELDYFAQPEGYVFGIDTSAFRVRVGELLEEQYPMPGDNLIIPIPDSANLHAYGFARNGRSGTCPPIGMMRHHHVGRTFINKEGAGVARKHVISRPRVHGRRVILIDDSIVRGNTSLANVQRFWEAGATEVHMFVAYPPWQYHCRYGVDANDDAQLFAARHNGDIESMRDELRVNSLGFLSPDALMQVVREFGGDPSHYCTACYSGEYWA